MRKLVFALMLVSAAAEAQFTSSGVRQTDTATIIDPGGGPSGLNF